MYLRGSAIRPVPPFAVLDLVVLQQVEGELAREAAWARAELDEAFGRFERTQPHVAESIGAVLARPLDETALALGYFLSISVWLGFERAFGARLREVSVDALRATEDAITLEEELRAQRADEPFDIEDVLALAQPGVLSFVHEHVEAALDGSPRSSDGAVREVDVDDVHLIYRSVLVLTLALSHAVAPGKGERDPSEMLA
jgi:hypothetical protein